MAILNLVLSIVVIVVAFMTDRATGWAISAFVFGVYGAHAFFVWRSRRWRKNLSSEKLKIVDDLEHQLWFIEEIRRKTNDDRTKDVDVRQEVKVTLEAMRRAKEIDLERSRVPDTQIGLRPREEKKCRNLQSEIKVLAKLADYFSRPFFSYFHDGLRRLENELKAERREAAYPYLEKIPKV